MNLARPTVQPHSGFDDQKGFDGEGIWAGNWFPLAQIASPLIAGNTLNNRIAEQAFQSPIRGPAGE